MYRPNRILFPGSKQGKSPINECSKIVRLGNKAKNRFLLVSREVFQAIYDLWGCNLLGFLV